MRLHDWPERLNRVLRWSASKRIDPSQHDCAAHACDAAIAVTGEDPGAAFRGQYATYDEGMTLLRATTGCRTLAAWADKQWPRVAVAEAKRGDWALVRWRVAPGDKLQTALAVVVGDGTLSGPAGTTAALSDAKRAWSVG